MARLYRRQPDSSVLSTPRVFIRVFPALGTLRETTQFYERLTAMTLDQDMDMSEAGLHVVAVGSFLLLELDREKLDEERYRQATATACTVLVPYLDAAVDRQLGSGAEIAQPRWESPPGPGVRLRHPDGLLVEYVEHRPSRDDVTEPAESLR